MSLGDPSPANPEVGLRILGDLQASADPVDAVGRARYFGALPGGYSQGDVHLGVRVPAVRAIVRGAWRQAGRDDLDLLVTSEFHEARLAAVLLAVEQFKRADETVAARLVAWVVANMEFLDNWDLVDSVAPHVVGEWVRADLARRDVLDALSTSANPWGRRFALVATHALIRGEEYRPTLELSARAITDDSVWVHKAAGWMLRELGQRDAALLDAFLDEHAAVMPRVMVRKLRGDGRFTK